MFFARARQTFFTPNAAFELHVSTDLLAPFHNTTSGTSVHLDPSRFLELQLEVRKDLEASLRRFVAAQYSNGEDLDSRLPLMC